MTGPLSSPATLTFPGYQNFLGVLNTTGQQVTVKCSGGVGVAIPNGASALLYCDATDYYNAAPSLFSGAVTIAGQLHGMSPGTVSNDGVTVAQLAAAIAASVPLGTAGTLLNSVADTTRDFLNGKLAVSGFITKSTNNAGGNEATNVGSDDGQIALYAGAFG